MIPIQDKHDGFGMIHLGEIQNYFLAIHERKLLPRDFVVLFALISYMDSKTAKVRFTLKILSEQINMHSSSVSASLKRLKDAFIIAKVVERNGDKYYLISPYLISVGSKKKWGHLHSLFTNAFE